MFVKFECGCIGIIGGHAEEHRKNTVALQVCDNEESSFCFMYRDLSDKSYNIMSDNEVKEIIRAIDQLVADGYLIKRFTNTLQYLLQRD